MSDHIMFVWVTHSVYSHASFIVQLSNPIPPVSSDSINLSTDLDPPQFALFKDEMYNVTLKGRSGWPWMCWSFWKEEKYMYINIDTWAFYQIRHTAGCACAGNAGNVFPTTDFKRNRWLAIPACIIARAWRTCRDACWDRWPAVAEKTFSAQAACATRNLAYLKRGPASYLAATGDYIELISFVAFDLFTG